jgi:hypothetical protein
MRILLLITILFGSFPANAWFTSPAKDPEVPDQQCFKRCIYLEKNKHVSGTNAENFCLDDCRRVKKERLELGLDYVGYRIKQHKEDWAKANPRTPEFFAAVKAGAQCFKDCIRNKYDEDLCDDECDAVKDNCVRDCVNGGKPQKECFMNCGNLDPLGKDPWDFDGYNYQELTKKQLDHVRMLDYQGQLDFAKSLNQPVPVERQERPESRGRIESEVRKNHRDRMQDDRGFNRPKYFKKSE